MNYYIQGDAANASQIKAAFDKLGCDTTGWKFNVEDGFYYTHDGRIDLACGNFLINLIKTHPDYKELELPVVPKYKKGDWIACDADSFTLSIKSVKDGNYYFHQGASLPIKDIDEHYHLWTIQDAKDGDVLVSGIDNPFIYYKPYYDDGHAYYYVGIDGRGNLSIACFRKKQDLYLGSINNVIPATKEQRDQLFAKIKEAGYNWDEKKKELKKIQPHYDISNFNPFDKVLVRYDDSCTWGVSFLGRYDGMFICCSNICFTQCIPFNDDTKHLLGTTDMCDEMYINW